MRYFVKILSAPEATLVGVKFPLAEGENLAGRITPPCTITLDGKKVSKQHCRFTVQGTALRVEDLGSSNGLFLNGKKISSAALQVRDRLVVGDYTLEIGNS